MMRPSELGTSMLTDFWGRAAAGAEAAACTSEARISPPGPEARTVARSIPSSLASRRALGEIFAPDAGADATLLAGVAAAWDGPAFACDPALAAGTADSLSTGGASPGAT